MVELLRLRTFTATVAPFMRLAMVRAAAGGIRVRSMFSKSGAADTDYAGATARTELTFYGVAP